MNYKMKLIMKIQWVQMLNNAFDTQVGNVT